MPDGQTGKKSKRPDKRPARKMYWARRTLEKRKVKHLMKNNGMTREAALRFWQKHRLGRIPDGYIFRGV